MKTAPILIVLLACIGCHEPAHTTTIENQRSESVQIYIDGVLQQPVVEGKTTKKLEQTVYGGGAIGIVAKSTKDGTEIWKKEYRSEEMNAIRKDDGFYFVIPTQ